MHYNSEVFMFVGNKVIKVFLNFILKNQCRSDFTCAMAGWTNLLCIYTHLRLHPLPGNLHKPKFRNGKNSMFSPVQPHKLFHCLQETLLIIRKLHIYEINYYYSAYI